jgi:HD superfamily phosphohydrolase
MLSTEMQRLREIRLCNINSLFLTGSANINRFEHSIGTAYLALLNIESPAQKKLRLSQKEINTFIISALIHDIANGPFGHSYEYIKQKQGFVPEKGIKDVVSDGGEGLYKQSVTLPVENIFFGKPKSLNAILVKGKIEINEISKIIEGQHSLSPLINGPIDLDNIDNVFRMAYHMGIRFRTEAPIILAKSMYLRDGGIMFKPEAKQYLEEWYKVRSKTYELLLLNPQEFASKYMLTEAIDIVFDCINSHKNNKKDIKWYYSDYELLNILSEYKEIWLKKNITLHNKIDTRKIRDILRISSLVQRKNEMRAYLESLQFVIPIKEKGKSSNINKLILNDDYKLESKDKNSKIIISDRSMQFIIDGERMYKVVNLRYNPAHIISRLMTGDLYNCLMILQTENTDKYDDLIDYSIRYKIEEDIDTIIKSDVRFRRLGLKVGIHPILDINKTDRKLYVKFDNSDNITVIGSNSSKRLLIGIFLKNDPYGLCKAKTLIPKLRLSLQTVIKEFLSSTFSSDIFEAPLFSKADKNEK